ncbi:25-hydroxycholesterol 7-alpha-hydroxylase [Liparis tanakae]|uniref:25-hydroxycholesterol 7-alpha-hydroxylase n=1 Tax=Liparis tanakae TaxID=230148 RepID=A0A4Z2E4B0_9TELE|nr:25-hydroxycholesterol 7-alpha-hydroxylase [Liparis tanakae]
MTFIMDPLLYASVARHGQLDFHQFSDTVAPGTFGYPPVLGGRFPGLHEQIHRGYRLLQGEHLSALTRSVGGRLLQGGGWRSAGLYDFCNAVVFEATFLALFGGPAPGARHADAGRLREAFVRFDSVFPLLIAQVPIGLLGRTGAARDRLLRGFLPHKVASWCGGSLFVRTRCELLDRYEALEDVDKAAHHLTILWASVGNTGPASFWALYHLLRHPEGLRRVRQELHAVLGPGAGGRDVKLDPEQLGRLVYLERRDQRPPSTESAVSESLRLASASMNIRVAQEDFGLRLGGERTAAVRKGDFIALYPQSMHLDPEVYEEPQVRRRPPGGAALVS